MLLVVECSATEHRSQAVLVYRSRLLKCTFVRDVRASSQSGKEYLLAGLGVPVHTKQLAVAFSPKRVMAFGAFPSLSSRSMRCGLVNIAADTALVEAEL